MSNIPRLLSTVLLDEPLVADAASRGVDVDMISFTQIRSNTENDIWVEIEEMCRMPLVVVFTSANAVRAVEHILRETRPGWKVFCVGHATRKAVEQFFDPAAILGVGNNAAEVGAAILTKGIGDVVFFCGDKRLDTLPAMLREQGVKVHELIVYHTLEIPRFIGRHYDGILFFSPGAVNSFFSMNKVPAETVLFAIGETTAAAIRNKSENVIFVGDMPLKERLLQQAIEYVETKQNSHSRKDK